MALGRPRAFDVDKALDSALQVFWRRGYEGTSLSDLTEAMGINRPSLYAAFGNKEELFRKALDRYADGPAAFIRDALNEPTARGVVQRMLNSSAALLTDPCHPPGCLAVQGALSCGEAAASIKEELTKRRTDAQALLYQRLKRAKDENDLPAHADPCDLARFVTTINQGMAVQAAGGASREQLQRVIDTAMSAWPTK